jgi:hypothetical protein
MIVGSEGDNGDLVFLLGILSELPGGPHTLLLQPSKVTKGGGIINAYNLVADLVKAQHYIEDCRRQQPGERCEWNSGNFRGAGFHVKTETLMKAHLKHLIKTHGVGHEITGRNRWLAAEPHGASAARVVINRTARYRNAFFPWKRIVEHYGDLLLFVGLPSEHAEFCQTYGIVEHQPTKTLLELAEVIEGAELFIGNQSVANAIAEGLKKRMIQEVSHELPDCIFKRDSAQHCDTGSVTLPAIGNREDLHLQSPLANTCEVTLHTTPPPGYWEYQGMRSAVFMNLVKECGYNGVTQTNKELEMAIIRENVLRVPEFFLQGIAQNKFSRTETARITAGYTPRTIREMIL